MRRERHRVKRRDSEITLLQKQVSRLEQAEEALKQDRRHRRRSLAYPIQSTLSIGRPRLAEMKERVLVQRRASLSPTGFEKGFDEKWTSELAFRSHIKKELNKTQDLCRITPETPKVKFQRIAISLSKKVNSEKLRMILFKHKDQFGLDKLFNHRKRLENDRVKNLKNFKEIEEKKNGCGWDEKEWQANLQKTLNLINEQVLDKIRQEGKRLASEFNSLKKTSHLKRP